MPGRYLTIAIVATCLSVLSTGCARLGIQPPPDPSEVVALPESMVLMPVADDRAEPYSHGEVRNYVREAAGKVLAKKGYVVVPYQALEGVDSSPVQGIVNLTGDELAALGPEGAEWLLFVSVTKIVEGYDSSGPALDIGVTGIVVNRNDGTVLWRSAGSSRSSKRGGLLRLLPPTPAGYNSAYDALQALFAYIPKAGAS
jgi:hypothetical protein